MDFDILIRRECNRDYKAVENLVRESFWNIYRPGCTEHYVLHCMRKNPDFVPELDFVMLRGGEIIGQNIFVRANITADDGRKIPVMSMGPICISPEYQRKGIGARLIDFVRETAKSEKAETVKLGFLYDIPELRSWYEKRGFVLTCVEEYPTARVGRMEWRV